MVVSGIKFKYILRTEQAFPVSLLNLEYWIFEGIEKRFGRLSSIPLKC